MNGDDPEERKKERRGKERRNEIEIFFAIEEGRKMVPLKNQS